MALSSSGLASTRSKQAASISESSSIPASLTPSRKAIGDMSSRIVPSGNYSGTEYFVKTDLAVLLFSRSISATRMKQCSAMSSISSSSMNLLISEVSSGKSPLVSFLSPSGSLFTSLNPFSEGLPPSIDLEVFFFFFYDPNKSSFM